MHCPWVLQRVHCGRQDVVATNLGIIFLLSSVFQYCNVDLGGGIDPTDFVVYNLCIILCQVALATSLGLVI